jgi:DNA-binding NarL/FixJ family response regulator
VEEEVMGMITAGLSAQVLNQPTDSPLTAQETLVAELAARGLSNKQIGTRLSLSHRTVSAHLYHIFPKLGISRRAALRDALNRLR